MAPGRSLLSAAMQDADPLAKRPPDNEQRFDQHGQVGNILDQLLNTCFKPEREKRKLCCLKRSFERRLPDTLLPRRRASE
jgi:hypothetical protein